LENYTLNISGSGPDLFLQYYMDFDISQQSKMDMNISMKMYASFSKGGGRSVLTMDIPVIGHKKFVTLTHFNDPSKIIILNERKKQYSIINAEPTKREQKVTYSITKIGNEKIHGLSTVHVKATGSDGEQFELWTSREIPGYEKVIDFYKKNQKLGGGQLWEALTEADADGYMVKMKVVTEKANSVIELT